MLPTQLTAETLQKKNPQLYDELIQLGVDSISVEHQAELKVLQDSLSASKLESKRLSTELEVAKRKTLLTEHGASMRKPVKAAELVANTDLSLAECLSELIIAPVEKSGETGTALSAFEETVPESLGSEEEIDVANWSEAKLYVAKKYSLTNTTDITKRARREFNHLIGK